MNCSRITTICLILFCFNSTLASPGLSVNSADYLRTADTVEPIRVRIEMIEGAIRRIEPISITIEDSDFEMGGFDFLIAYDSYNLAFIGVDQGQFLNDCEWEYFTFSHGFQGSCGSACPSGLLRISAVAEISNGPNHPSCYAPPGTDPHELARMRFLVTNDRYSLWQYLRISFYWDDCDDNSISSRYGETIYINHAIFDDQNNLIWDEDDNVEYPDSARPQGVGAPDNCLEPDPEGPNADRKIDFVNGGLNFYVIWETYGGDVNLNGELYEVSDAALLANYFVYGLSVFTVNVEGQIAATDINEDGIVLSIADLVALIRIVTGDYLLNQKLAPVTTTIKAGQTVSVNATMAAAHLIVAGDVTPTLLANNMEMKYNFDGNNTRILVYSFEQDQTFDGDFIDINKAELLTINLATYNGAPVLMKTLPADFTLHQNYPNPFNPSTKISFAVPASTDYKLTIFNVQGQAVRTISGHAEPGPVELSWDASNFSSGIYFYRLNTDSFTETKKMLLLK